MASAIRSVVPVGESFFKDRPQDDRIGANPGFHGRGLKRNGFLKRGKRLSRASKLRMVAERVYRKKRDTFLHEHPICEFPECFAKSQDTHHAAGRTGKNYLDSSTWLAMCRNHHTWIHSHARAARVMGLLAPLS